MISTSLAILLICDFGPSPEDWPLPELTSHPMKIYVTSRDFSEIRYYRAKNIYRADGRGIPGAVYPRNENIIKAHVRRPYNMHKSRYSAITEI